MKLRTTIASAAGALALAAAAYAPAALADRVGFNLTFGGPGYAVNVGNAGYYDYGYYDRWRPAPVVVAPYVPYYRPYRAYYAPVVVPVPVYVRPYRAYRHYDHQTSYVYPGHWRDHDRAVGYVYYDR